MRLTVDILEDFVASLDLSGNVISFSDDGTNTTIVVDNTYHLRKNMNVDIDGTDYLVFSVVNDTSIEVEGLIIDPQVYTVPNPFYFHGTPMATNSQINGREDDDKVPMVYLYEILREKKKDINSSIDRESDLRLFFLDNANFSDWTTDDHYSQRIVGLNSLVDSFIEQALDFKLFYLDETDFTRVNHINWGVYTTDKGYEKRLFDDDLTGVELSFTLPIRECS